MEVLLESSISLVGEPLLVMVCSWDQDISVVGVVESMVWGVESVSVAVVSKLDSGVDTFHEPCDLWPLGGVVLWTRELTKKG